MRGYMRLLCILLLSTLSAITWARESQEFANKVIQAHALPPTQAERLRKILTTSHGLTRNIGSEDEEAFRGPNNSYHPVSRAQCRRQVLDTGIIQPSRENEEICGARWMAPIPGPDGKAGICIDQFEFPNIPCEYPLVWVPSYTANQI